MVMVDIQEIEAKFSALLAAVEEKGEWVRICRNGKPIADLRPVCAEAFDPLQKNPELMGIQFFEDPTLPLSEEDCR